MLVYISNYTTKGNSRAVFHNNNARYGGAVNCISHCNIIFKENVLLNFYNNSAKCSGGAVHCEDHVIFVVEGESNVIFANNNAAVAGGAITQ